MLGYQKLKVYQKIGVFQLEYFKLFRLNSIPESTTDQMRRASESIELNLAEGSARLTQRDQRRFYVTARSSAVECHAITQNLARHGIIDEATRKSISERLEEITAMLYGMIKRLD